MLDVRSRGEHWSRDRRIITLCKAEKECMYCDVHCRKWAENPLEVQFSWWDCMQANVSHEFALREHSLDILGRRIISNNSLELHLTSCFDASCHIPTHACAILTRVHVHIPWCHNCPLELPTLLFASLVLCRHLQEINIATKRWSNMIWYYIWHYRFYNRWIHLMYARTRYEYVYEECFSCSISNILSWMALLW